MSRAISKLLIKAVDGAVDLLIGVFIGLLMAVFLISQHPVISKIMNSEGGDRETRFVVTCQASTKGQVKCLKEEGLANAN